MALRKAFKYFDSDASGDIDPDEFYAAMHAFGLEFTEDQVLALFGCYDVDRDGGLSYYEFIDKVLESDWGAREEREKVILAVQLDDEEVEMKSVLKPEELSEARCRKLFAHFDCNGSGEIDMRELGLLVKGLGMRMEQESINNAMVDLDKNNNGSISFDEFWDWFKTAATTKVSHGSPSRAIANKMNDVLASAKKSEGLHTQGSAIKPDQQAAADDEVQQIQGQNPNRSTTRQGNWMSRTIDRPKTASSWRRCSQPDNNRPMSALASASRGSSRKAWGSDTWKSVSRCDFRPPSACSVQPPRLNIPKVKKRPMSAQPLLRSPGDPTGPYGSTSGFRL